MIFSHFYPLRFFNDIFDFGNAITVLEISLGALIFLLFAPKKENFILKYILSTITILGISIFVPHLKIENNDLSQFVTFLRYLLFVALTIVPILFSFDVSLGAAISAACSGYCLQHLTYRITRIILNNTSLLSSITNFNLRYHTLQIILSIFTYAGAFFSIGYLSKKSDFYKSKSIPVIILSILLVIICVGITRLTDARNVGDNLAIIALCFIGITGLFSILYALKASEEKLIVERMMHDERRQYELSKANIDLINIKCHDLKHQIADFNNRLSQDEIDLINKTISSFDSSFRSGNKALDIVLSQKILICNNKNIKLTCFGNGKALDFIKESDIFSLFGNALDNAIEAVNKVADPSKKVISLTIKDDGGMIVITVLNYFNEEININNGNLKTTKKHKEYHGFGVKSIDYIAKKYNGEMAFFINKDIFTLNIYLTR